MIDLSTSRLRKEDPPQLWVTPTNRLIFWLGKKKEKKRKERKRKKREMCLLLRAPLYLSLYSLCYIGCLWVSISSVFCLPMQTHPSNSPVIPGLQPRTDIASLISFVLWLPSSWSEQLLDHLALHSSLWTFLPLLM